MGEVGIDISTHRAKSLAVFDETSFDYVVTLCANAHETCPLFPGGATYLHHSFDDPVSVAEPSSEQCAPFRHVRDKIKDWIEITFAS